VPPHLFSTCAPIWNVACALGQLIAVFGGMILPPDNSLPSVLASSGKWRWLFGLQSVFLIFILLHMVLVIRWDSPKFYLMQGTKEGEE
jgi:MFS family permease